VTYDIVVCGAGPAGSVVARRLAAGGARVALVGTASRPGWEGLSIRSRALLIEEGLDGKAAVITGPYARCGIWARGRPVEGAEWLVDRSQLADALRGLAVAAGALHRADAVTSTKRVADNWRVCLRNGEVLTAPILIDARGRRGAQQRGPLLLAYGQKFLRQKRGMATGIGAADFGWCWWAERGHELWVQVIRRPRCGPPAAWVAAAAAQIPALARALKDAVIVGSPVARPAHARLGVAGGDPTLWQVGDAALALDPLSGQGVYEALRGARLAVTAIRSVIDGGDALLAHRFIAARREEGWQRGVRVAAGFYRENAERGAFWTDTAAAYAALSPDRGEDAAAARIERRPVLENGRILERDVIVTAENTRGVWQVAGVPLVALKAFLESGGDVPVDGAGSASPAIDSVTIAGAAAALDRPPVAVASAIRWLQNTGHMLQQVPSQRSPPHMSLGG
jgi:menaquinone-9 beta-reductase